MSELGGAVFKDKHVQRHDLSLAATLGKESFCFWSQKSITVSFFFHVHIPKPYSKYHPSPSASSDAS